MGDGEQNMKGGPRRAKPHPAVAGVAFAVALAVAVVKRFRRRSKRALPSHQPCQRRFGESSEVVTPDDWVFLKQGRTSGSEHQVSQPVAEDANHAVTIERTMPCSSMDVLMYLFHPSSGFWGKFQAQRQVMECEVGPWLKQQDQGVTQWSRTLRYSLPLNQRIGPSVAHTIESHTITHASLHSWSATICAVTPFVPMGSDFFCSLHLTGNDHPPDTPDAANTPNAPASCCIRVFGNVIFPKRMPFRELLIRRPASVGMRQTYTLLLDLLQQQLAPGSDGTCHGLALSDALSCPPRSSVSLVDPSGSAQGAAAASLAAAVAVVLLGLAYGLNGQPLGAIVQSLLVRFASIAPLAST